MWRYLIGFGAALVLAIAGYTLLASRPKQATPLPAVGTAPAGDDAAADMEDAVLPEATARTREQRRFDRYDKDRDDIITRDEFLASRRKAYAKLDTNGDGRLSFDEWVVKTADRFAGADKDKSRTLTRAEFATTAPKRRPPRQQAKCICPPAGEGDTDN